MRSITRIKTPTTAPARTQAPAPRNADAKAPAQGCAKVSRVVAGCHD